MENKLDTLSLALMTLLLFLMLALGSLFPGLSAQLVEPAGALETWDGLHGLWASPAAGGGSGA